MNSNFVSKTSLKIFFLFLYKKKTIKKNSHIKKKILEEK